VLEYADEMFAKPLGNDGCIYIYIRVFDDSRLLLMEVVGTDIRVKRSADTRVFDSTYVHRVISSDVVTP